MLHRNWRFLLLGTISLLGWLGSISVQAQPLSLWEVKSAKTTVYLFGSVHVCKADCFPLPRAVMKRFAASPTLAVELDATRDDLQSKMSIAANYPQGDSLDRHLDPAQLRGLRSILNELGLPEQVVMHLQPWMVETLLTLTVAQRSGYAVEQGIDLWFIAQARNQGKSIVELETVERQLQALTYESEAVQIKSLATLMHEIKKGTLPGYLDELIGSWRQGNSIKLDNLMRDERFMGGSTAWLDELLDRRNEEMAAKIANSIEAGKPMFVVVGVAHLVGRNNVGELLARRGYKVRQIESTE